MAQYLYTGDNSQAVQDNLFCGMISVQVVWRLVDFSCHRRTEL